MIHSCFDTNQLKFKRNNMFPMRVVNLSFFILALSTWLIAQSNAADLTPSPHPSNMPPHKPGQSLSRWSHETPPTQPPQPAPSCECEPSPEDFTNMKQYEAYKVIKRFKGIITSDPLNITGTWVGTKICDNDEINTYRGFYCDTPPGTTDLTIAAIDFNGFHLGAPTLDGFINGFPDLALFHANSNNFSGTVPDLSGLPYFYELDLSNNNFSGPFPTNVVPLTNLAFLDLRFNHFEGPVPSQIFYIGYEALFLNNNIFDSSIPASLGSSPVEYLTFANNRFTGPIPASICNTSRTLLEVLFLNNQFSGCLPYEIGYLRDLTVFDVGMNQLTGYIPLSFGCLSNIEQLNLAQNSLYGMVPDVVCQLAKTGNLVNLSLSDNYFTSLGPNCWDLLHTNVLDMRNNCIVGLPNQKSPIECHFFFSLPRHCPYIAHMPCEVNPRRNATCYDRTHWPWHFDHSPPLPH
ncbi:Leucine-rich repeat (LRR) family protein [Rhynchospora pubera]|uniref:Leucine-rich repeat (LRR) family protein n=1 Tax=Rhynchospora pubera TaxID=906938 RepID=A0AAV8F4P4_9POAL|nr:Leucine-rich repeat (LRR) family protein [Rhynchospora pubera]